MTRWIVDGNNVMGSRPDGWWNDRPAAMARLGQEIAEWSRTHEDRVLLVFDGRRRPDVAILAGGNLAIVFAERSARDAADDVIASEATPDDRVVTADRGLIARLPPGAEVIGPRRYLDLLSSRADAEG